MKLINTTKIKKKLNSYVFTVTKNNKIRIKKNGNNLYKL